MGIENLSLKKKLTLSFFSIAASILILTAVTFSQIMKQSLTERAFKQLSSIKFHKKTKILTFLNTQSRQIPFLISETIPKDVGKGNSRWFSEFKSTVSENELWRDISDVFIFKNGKVIYSISGKKALPRAVLRRLTGDDKQVDVFEVDSGSEKQQSWNLWMIYPIEKSNTASAVFLFSTERINTILKERYGMGISGESYLVGAKDHLLRSDSRFLNPKDTLLTLRINTQSIREANNTDSPGRLVAYDYRGKKVLNSFDRIHFGELDWIILSKIDKDEVIEPLNQIYVVFGLVSVFGFFLAFIASSWIARRIALQEEKEKGLRRLSLYQGQESERERVSKELHDSIGQLLASALYKVEAFTNQSDAQSEVKALIKETIGEVRRISYDLAPRVLLSFGLIPSIKQLCELATQSSSVKFDFQYIEYQKDQRFSMDIERNLFRIVQESVHNVCKHSQATKCYVTFEVRQEKKTEIILSIRDNGVGLTATKDDKQKTLGKNGLKNIQERVEALEGSFKVQSHSTGGAEIEVIVPV